MLLTPPEAATTASDVYPVVEGGLLKTPVYVVPVFVIEFAVVAGAPVNVKVHPGSVSVHVTVI